MVKDTSNKNHNYIKFISYLQIIGIILVVFGHSFHEYPDGAEGHTLFIYRLLYNVRMPLFTFVSGYLLYFTSFVVRKSTRTWYDFTKVKIKRLLIPYFVLTLITFIPRASMSSIADDNIEISIASLLNSLVDADNLVIPYFWFILMSFILLVGVYAILRFAGNSDKMRSVVIWALVALFIILPLLELKVGSIFALNQVVRLGVYFMLGIVYCRYSAFIDKYLSLSRFIIAAVCATAWIVLFVNFEGDDLSRVASLFGIIFFVIIAQILECKNIKILDHLMGANFIIFLLSWYVNVATQQILSHFIVLPWWVYSLLSFFGGIYIPLLGYKYLVNHPNSRWVRGTAFLLGQNINKVY